MFEWSESQILIRDAVRRFIETEIASNMEALEHGDLPPYDILRKMYATFGLDEMARARFTKQIEANKRGETAKKNEGVDLRDRKSLNFVLDRDMPGFEQTAPLKKMQNLAFRTIELSAHGKSMSFAEASA